MVFQHDLLVWDLSHLERKGRASSDKKCENKLCQIFKRLRLHPTDKFKYSPFFNINQLTYPKLLTILFFSLPLKNHLSLQEIYRYQLRLFGIFLCYLDSKTSWMNKYIKFNLRVLFELRLSVSSRGLFVNEWELHASIYVYQSHFFLILGYSNFQWI